MLGSIDVSFLFNYNLFYPVILRLLYILFFFLSLLSSLFYFDWSASFYFILLPFFYAFCSMLLCVFPSIYAGMSFHAYIFYWDVSDKQVSKSSFCSWNKSDLRLSNFPYVKLGSRYITSVASPWSLWFLWSFAIFKA